MAIDLFARAPSVPVTPLIILRWIAAIGQLLIVMGSEALFNIVLPAEPLLVLIAASFIVNLYAMRMRRQVSEETARLYIAFDILQLCGFLYFTGGTANPFSILLLAPLAMAASQLSLYSLCLLIFLTIFGVSILSFGAWPLQWPEPVPVLSPSYQHGIWVALMVALIVISFIIWRLAMEGRRLNDALAHTRTILDEKRRTTALGALAAAAVHELGSPLGTIAVIAREMERETHPDDPLAEDIALLRDQTEKCKKILADLARNPEKTAIAAAPLRMDRLLMEIVSMALSAGERGIDIKVTSRVPDNLPFVAKSPDMEYGLGNLIGNAHSYARSKVTVNVEASAEHIEVTIQDDGPGFSPATLQSVGQPYISTRETRENHMGLGIFIAVNLLEATNAELTFANAPKGGASVRVVWPRNTLETIV